MSATTATTLWLGDPRTSTPRRGGAARAAGRAAQAQGTHQRHVRQC